MSWAEPSRPHRRRALAAVLLLPLALAGCIRPLYGPTPSGEALQDRLSAIVIDRVPDRFGHYLVQELGFNLNGSGTDGKARWRLSIQTSESVQSTVVNSITGTATSATLVGTASWTLTPIAGGAPILSATDTAFATYNRNEQRFASVRAARDAENRVAQQIADQMRNRIAAKLATMP